MTEIRMTTAQARKLGIDLSQAKPAKVRTRRTVRGEAYHTVCVACGEEFHTAAAEDRHVNETPHRNYRLVLGW